MDLQQVGEQLTIVHECLPEILGIRLTAGVALSDRARCAVIGDDARMIDGNVRGALLEFAQRVAACLHEVGDEPVGLRDSALRVVHELCLRLAPRFRKARRIIRKEWSDVQLGHATLAHRQLSLRRARVFVLVNSLVILRAEAVLEVLASATFDHEHADDEQYQHERTDDDGDVSVHLVPLHLCRQSAFHSPAQEIGDVKPGWVSPLRTVEARSLH